MSENSYEYLYFKYKNKFINLRKQIEDQRINQNKYIVSQNMDMKGGLNLKRGTKITLDNFKLDKDKLSDVQITYHLEQPITVNMKKNGEKIYARFEIYSKAQYNFFQGKIFIRDTINKQDLEFISEGKGSIFFGLNPKDSRNKTELKKIYDHIRNLKISDYTLRSTIKYAINLWDGEDFHFLDEHHVGLPTAECTNMCPPPDPNLLKQIPVIKIINN
jgi:hypothetical protein